MHAWSEYETSTFTTPIRKYSKQLAMKKVDLPCTGLEPAIYQLCAIVTAVVFFIHSIQEKICVRTMNALTCACSVQWTPGATLVPAHLEQSWTVMAPAAPVRTLDTLIIYCGTPLTRTPENILLYSGPPELLMTSSFIPRVSRKSTLHVGLCIVIWRLLNYTFQMSFTFTFMSFFQ